MDVFNPETYQKILDDLQGSEPDQISAFDTIASLLLLGEDTRLEMTGFPLARIATIMVSKLKQITSEILGISASNCLVTFLRNNATSTRHLVKAGALPVLASHLLEIKSPAISDNCLVALEIITRYRPAELGETVGITPFITNLSSYSDAMATIALKAIRNITDSLVSNDFVNCIPSLVEIHASGTESIAKLAIDCIGNIAMKVRAPPFLIDMLAPLADNVGCLSALVRLSEDRGNTAVIINAHINFEKIFDLANTEKDQRRILTLIQNLLPPPKLPRQLMKEVPHDEPSEESKAFVAEIQPLLAQILATKPLSCMTLLLCFISTLAFNVPPMTEEIALSLLDMSKSSSTSPYVLTILTFYRDDVMIGDCGILDTISGDNVYGVQRTWFEKTVRDLKLSTQRKDCMDLCQCSFAELVDAIQKNEITKFAFANSGAKRMCSLLKDEELDLSEGTAHMLIAYILSLLGSVAFPPVKTVSINSIVSNLCKPGMISVQSESGKISFTATMLDSIASLESMWNLRLGNVTLEKVYDQAELSPQWKEILIGENATRIHVSHLAIISRCIGYNDYRCLSFKLRSGETHGPGDTILDLVRGQIGIGYDSFVARVDANMEDMRNRHRPFPKMLNDSAADLITILNILSHKVAIEVDDTFDKKIRGRMTDIVSVLAGRSQEIAMVYMVPPLFSFDTRALAFRLAVGSTKNIVTTIAKDHGVELDMSNATSEAIKVYVHRDAIFSDGALIFQNLSWYPLPFEIEFVGENGFGKGPTNEFFTSFSHELCKSIWGIFRSHDRTSEYCVDPRGMFISTVAPPRAVELFGTVCAKALETQHLIDININPAWFKFVREKPVDIREVDEMLAKSIDSITPEDVDSLELVFIYPYPEFIMVENGDTTPVTAENLDIYKYYMREYTCGSMIAAHRDSFLAGFSQVMPFSRLDVFTEEEICRMLTGDKPCFTREDLEEHVICGHGYTLESPAITMFFDIICEFSPEEQKRLVKFITGYSQLPVGGIAALEPKLTIAKRDFDIHNESSLPTVSTCHNYVKLPSYNTKEIMRERLLLAITEGQGEFELS